MKNLEVLSINVGESIDYKFGLITYDVCRVDDNWFELTDTSSGWVTATLTRNELSYLLQGKITVIDLNWN